MFSVLNQNSSVHILLAIYHFESSEKVTSTFIANSIQTNPVIIRNLLGKLQKAGLAKVEPGVGGAHLSKKIEDITLLDVFLAVDDHNNIFKLHGETNERCEVGNVAHAVIDPYLENVHDQFMESLQTVTLDRLALEMESQIAKNNK